MSPHPTSLRFTPRAWAKLLFLRDYGETEVGGFGIAADNDLLLVKDFQLVQQTCSVAHVEFEDASVADFFDVQIDAGRQPEQCGRIWMHTHPGDCPLPSTTDERTFDRVFGNCDWAVMFILARRGQSYARLRFNQGPTAELEIPIDVDYDQPFAGTDFEAWEDEYLQNVVLHSVISPPTAMHDINDDWDAGSGDVQDDDAYNAWDECWFENALYNDEESEVLTHDEF